MNKVAEMIEAKGLRKGYVAQKAGISSAAMSNILSGRTKEPTLSVAIKLARVLNSSVEELFGDIVD